MKRLVLFLSHISFAELNKVGFLLPFYVSDCFGCEAHIVCFSIDQGVPREVKGVRIHQSSIPEEQISCLRPDVFIAFGFGHRTPNLADGAKEGNANCITMLVTDHAVAARRPFSRRVLNWIRFLVRLPLLIERYPKEKRLGLRMRKSYDYYLSENEESAEDIRKHGWLHVDVSDKIELLNMGCDDSLFDESHNRTSMENKENSFFYAGHIGTWYKNHELLLRALRHIKDLNGWKFVMAGDVSEPFQKKLNRFLKRNPRFSDAFIFLGAIKDKKEMMACYDRYKAFICTSRQESFGYSLLEAVASGEYILSTRVGVAPVITGNGRFGSLIEPGDYCALARAISAVIRGEIDLSGLAPKSRAVAFDTYSYKKIVSHFHLFIDNLSC